MRLEKKIHALSKNVIYYMKDTYKHNTLGIYHRQIFSNNNLTASQALHSFDS